MFKHPLKTALALAVTSALCACGGGDASPEAPEAADAPRRTAQMANPVADAMAATATATATDTGPTMTAQRQRPRLRDLLPDPGKLHNQVDSISVGSYPHAIDVYRPKNASKAIVFLHGGSGTKEAIAYQMGLKTSPEGAATLASVRWSELEATGTMAVFPQGQTTAGNARTWSNHAMTSGQDDMAFLRALVAELRSRYGINDISVAGHSMGGAMVNRLWCEAPDAFKAYVSFAGPASSHYLGAQSACSQGGRAPYQGFFGSADPVIQGDWQAATWAINANLVAAQPTAFINPVMVGEWQAFQYRAQAMCGQTPELSKQQQAGASALWSACGGRLQVQLAGGAGHDIASISAIAGQTPFALVASFTARF